MELELVRQIGDGLEKKTLIAKEGETLKELFARLSITLRQEEGLSIWGERVTVEHAPKAGDRIEITLPLRIAPMEARRKTAELRKKEAQNLRARRHATR